MPTFFQRLRPDAAPLPEPFAGAVCFFVTAGPAARLLPLTGA